MRTAPGDELRDALRTADLPFAALVRALAPDRHGQNPVFQATLTYQQSADGRLGDGFAIPSSGAHDTVGGVGVAVVDVPPRDVAFALSLYGARDGDRTVFRLVYQRDLVGEAVARAWSTSSGWRWTKRSASAETGDARRSPAPSLGWAPNLSEGFARVGRAVRRPDRAPLRREPTDLPGAGRNASARSPGRRRPGRRRREPVGILLDRSIDMVVAALAVSAPAPRTCRSTRSTPAARVALILADAAPSLVLTSAALADRVAGRCAGACSWTSRCHRHAACPQARAMPAGTAART